MTVSLSLIEEGASCRVPYPRIPPFSPSRSCKPPSRWPASEPWPISCGNGLNWWCFCTPTLPYRTWPPGPGSVCTPIPCGIGVVVGPMASLPVKIKRAGGVRLVFPPLAKALVKAIACETVSQTGLPLSRLSTTDLATRARQVLGKPISPSTVWRILDADALKPWRYKYWLFPRDPRFAEKAERILDLYAGFWQGRPLGTNDYLLCADEKTSIQARHRCHPGLPAAPGRPAYIEHEYERGGALQYLAAWDVRRGYVMGRCEPATGIDPFARLVAQVMECPPYRTAERVFWVVDNGSSHRGNAAVTRLAKAYPTLRLVHTPTHASWLNQVEIYFSIIQRKVLTPNDFADLAEVEQRLHLYAALSNQQPRPFAWKFTRTELATWLERLNTIEAAKAPLPRVSVSSETTIQVAA